MIARTFGCKPLGILLIFGLVWSTGCPPNITWPTINLPPIANAGANQYDVHVGERVELNGRGSTDPDDNPLTYTWEQRSGPNVDLDNANSAQPSFVPAEDGTYEFALIVDDGRGGSDDATVSIFVEEVIDPTCPRADAGTDQTVNEGSAVTLRGGNSADPSGVPLTYEWYQLSGEQVSLNGVFNAEPRFAAPQVTGADVELEFELTVTNEQGCSDKGTVVITVRDRDPDDPCAGVECEDDAVFCNGVEVCVDGRCESTGDPCTRLHCNEESDACVGCTTNAECDDQDACTTDTCDTATGCANTDVDCDDGDLCTTDSCDSTTGCVHMPVECATGEACDPATGECVGCTTDVDCDDATFCNGAEVCIDGECWEGADPCAGSDCDEENDQCAGWQFVQISDEGICCDCYAPSLHSRQVAFQGGYSQHKGIQFWDGTLDDPPGQIELIDAAGYGPSLYEGAIAYEHTYDETYYWPGVGHSPYAIPCSGNTEWPLLYDRQIAYVTGSSSNYNIGLYDLDTGECSASPCSTSLVEYVQGICGHDWFAYLGGSTKDGPYNLYVCDGGTTYQITDTLQAGGGSCCGSALVWAERDGTAANDLEIFYRADALDPDTQRQITDNEVDDRADPVCCEGKVAWSGWDGHDYEIFYWDGVSVEQVTNNDVDDIEPSMHGGWIAYTTTIGSCTQIMVAIPGTENPSP